jgi:hypothetical protein
MAATVRRGPCRRQALPERRLRGAVVGAVALFGLAGAAAAQMRSVTGQAGILGEWELTATVSEQADGTGRRWASPLTLKHVGFCSADGPEERTGELRLRVSDPPGEATATLMIEGTACTFRGRLRDAYDGIMTCPDRRDVPMMLSIQ